ncbi:YajQ family cyclic di-GMP-binding protein [Rickettsiales bacterium]|nr:YajQ family cyclic di-GMP-binding protein [Rickettsiales bacterium]
MPTFDIVSKTDLAEVDNAINGAMREITTRYDFKGSEANINREELEILLIAEDNYKIDQVQQVMRTHFVKRKLETSALKFSDIEKAKGNTIKQKATIVQGIDRDTSQLINKEIKSSKLKVQVSIRGDELRVSGNKRDTLQEAITIVKKLNVKQPLQFINFRD